MPYISTTCIKTDMTITINKSNMTASKNNTEEQNATFSGSKCNGKCNHIRCNNFKDAVVDSFSDQNKSNYVTLSSQTNNEQYRFYQKVSDFNTENTNSVSSIRKKEKQSWGMPGCRVQGCGTPKVMASSHSTSSNSNSSRVVSRIS